MCGYQQEYAEQGRVGLEGRKGIRPCFCEANQATACFGRGRAGRVFWDVSLLLGRTLMAQGWGLRVGAIEELCQDLAVNVCLGVFTEFVSKYPLLENSIYSVFAFKPWDL